MPSKGSCTHEPLTYIVAAIVADGLLLMLMPMLHLLVLLRRLIWVLQLVGLILFSVFWVAILVRHTQWVGSRMKLVYFRLMARPTMQQWTAESRSGSVKT